MAVRMDDLFAFYVESLIVWSPWRGWWRSWSIKRSWSYEYKEVIVRCVEKLMVLRRAWQRLNRASLHTVTDLPGNPQDRSAAASPRLKREYWRWHCFVNRARNKQLVLICNNGRCPKVNRNRTLAHRMWLCLSWECQLQDISSLEICVEGVSLSETINEVSRDALSLTMSAITPLSSARR
jgi:hypothetical protein